MLEKFHSCFPFCFMLPLVVVAFSCLKKHSSVKFLVISSFDKWRVKEERRGEGRRSGFKKEKGKKKKRKKKRSRLLKVLMLFIYDLIGFKLLVT